MQEIEERILGSEDITEEMDNSVKKMLPGKISDSCASDFWCEVLNILSHCNPIYICNLHNRLYGCPSKTFSF